jgi:hypothetical protein
MANVDDVISPEVIVLFDEEEPVVEEIKQSPPTVIPEVEPPCVLVEGLLLEEELGFLAKYFDSEEDTVSLYVRVGEVVRKIGRFRVSLDNILVLRNLGYKSRLFLPDGRDLDLLDESLYIKFIRI